MVVGPGQTLRRRKLGKELRQHREAAGLTVRQVSEYVGLQPGTITKIEKGRQAILPRNVRLILQACTVGAPTMDNLIRLAEESDDRGWWTAFSDTMPDWFETYVSLEGDAEEIWIYSAELFDGQTQTPATAEALARTSYPDITESQLKRSVELRKARQAHLEQKQPTLRIVLNEAVIRRPIGGTEVMREQLRHLLSLMERPNITIQVLPFAAGAHAGMKSSFTLLRFPEGFNDMDCVYLENENGAVWQERPADIARYSDVFTRLRDAAVSPEETRALLDSLVQ
jgi:transcriptional regulator with XRE-family HTH domain